MFNVTRIIAFVAIILTVTACESTSNENLFEEKISVLENKVQELQSTNDNLRLLNSELQDKLLEKDAELIHLRSSLDFDLGLTHSNIDRYYGVFGEGLWGDYGHIYSGHIKALLHRLFFTEEYWWVEGDKVEENPVENMLLKEEFRNHLLGIKFVEPITSNVEFFPQNIKEVALYAMKDQNKVFMLDNEQKWYAFDILDDTHLKTDFRALHLIIKSYNDWISKP